MKATHFITACWISALLLLSAASRAQDNERPMHHQMHQKIDAKSLTDSMKTRLSLTAEQYPKVLAINQNFIDGISKLKDTPATDSTAAGAQVKTLSENRDAELKKVLTNEQYTTYQEQKQRMMHKTKKHQ
jgi:Spy/CpxP family protein refolding chaperone